MLQQDELALRQAVQVDPNVVLARRAATAAKPLVYRAPRPRPLTPQVETPREALPQAGTPGAPPATYTPPPATGSSAGAPSQGANPAASQSGAVPVQQDPRAAPPNFGPGNDAFRSQRITGTYAPQHEGRQVQLVEGATVAAPGAIAGTDLSRAREALSRYQGEIGNVALTAQHNRVDNPLTFDAAADTQALRGRITQGVDTLFNAPNRQQIAAETLRLAEEQAAPLDAMRLRQVVQRAAAAGRTKSGMTTNDLTGVEQDARNRRDILARSVSNDAAAHEMSDRLARLSAVQGAQGQLFGQDTTDAQIEQSLRGEARGERDFWAQQDLAKAQLAAQRAGLLDTVTGRETDMAQIGRRDLESDRDVALRVAEGNAARDLQRAQVLGGMDAQRFGVEGQLRDELRGEREYANVQEGRAFDRTRQQVFDEEALQDAALDRTLRLAREQGAGGDNSQVINALLAAAQAGGPGSTEAIQQLMYLFGQRQAAA